MFSSVFDKVVSATAPNTLATFPPRGDLPASASTLCCLSFADRFISQYPIACDKHIGDGADDSLLLERVGPSVGIAISTDNLESTMEGAAELGGRLAAALAGTVRSKRRERATASVPDLLTKVRGIFGNRLACVGREIRVSRNVQAERDETLLLRQIHALKNAALDACNGEKWCIVVSSGGESLVVCSIPLPAVEEGGAYGCDFLVFDPWPRPAMKLRGSYIVKFTTVRGLQLHLLSALGEIWRVKGLPAEGGAKGEFVGLSVVMEANRSGEQPVGRRQLQDNVTRLRKAEKEAAIQAKRQEVEALRRALEKSSQPPQATLTAPISGGMFGLTDGASEVPQGSEVSDLSSGPPSFRRSAQGYRQQQPPRATVDRSLVETSSTCDGDIEQAKPEGNAAPKSLAMARSPPLLLGSPAPHVKLTDQQSQGDHCKLPNSRNSSIDRSQLRPPVAGVSPQLSAQTPEGEEGWRCWSDDGGGAAGKTEKGELLSDRPSKGREDAPRARGRENSARDRPALQVPGHTDPDGAMISDNPLHRALLRPVEGEELAEYSQRAYSVYRAHGVIQDGTGLDDFPASEPTADDVFAAPNQLFCLLATSAPASQASAMHGASSWQMTPDDDVDQHGGGRKACGPVGVGVHDAVTPFSPPPSSPQLLRPEAGEEQPLTGNRKRSAESFAQTSGHGPRGFDVAGAEGVESQKPGKPATETFRSRLQAPRAGKALALASANAHGRRRGRREESSLVLCRHDVSGKELLPVPPPSSETTLVPPRPKEAWINEGEDAAHEHSVRTGDHETERAYSMGSVRSALEVSDEDEDGILTHSSTLPGKVVEHSEGKRVKRHPARQRSKSAQDMEGQERVADGIERGRGGNSERRLGDEHAIKAEMPQGRPMERPATVEGYVRAVSPAPSISKATTPRKTPPHVPRLETTSASNSFSTTVVVAPPPLSTRAQGLHRSRKGDTGDHVSTEREGLGVPQKAHEHEEFVWFGQPDTSPECRSDEHIENVKEVRDDEEARARAPADAAQKTLELQFGQVHSPHEQHRSKAQLLLQTEVRRQRAIIEQAFRAREEERRLRRARIGAEVFKRIQDLRRRRPPYTSEVPTVPPISGGKQPPPPVKRESSTNDDQEREWQTAMHRGQDAAAASRPHAEEAVMAWGFRPAPVENAAKAAQHGRLAPDATPTEGAASVGRVPPAETAAPTPPAESAHRAAAAAENPWRRVVSRQEQPELKSGFPAMQKPKPPPIRFNVEASTFLDGAEKPEGGINHEHEKARRQERYEALRAKKMAEAEDRKRGQKQRQATAKEHQRKKAAAAAAVADGEQPYGQDFKNDPRRQNLAQHGLTAADRPSFRQNGCEHTSGQSTVRPRSSSLTKNDESYTKPGVSSLADSAGSGGGRPKVPAPSAGNVASPAIRGFSRRSNRKLVRNAINFLCLAGGHLEKKKARVLEALDSHPASNFVVLLAHTKLLSFKGLYACSGEEDGTADRVFGLGPPQVDASMVSGFYKYNSAAREFREVHSKSLGKTTDAVSMEPTRLRRPKGFVTQ